MSEEIKEDQLEGRYHLRPRNAQGRVSNTLPATPFNSTATSTPRAEKEKKNVAKKPKKLRKEQLPGEDDPQAFPEESSSDDEVAVDEPPKRKIILKTRETLVRSVSTSTSATIVANHTVQNRIPQSSFEDLVGIEAIKLDLMTQVVGPFARPSHARALNMAIPKGLLLTGKPGTGKTCIADAIVTEVRKHRASTSYFQETGGCLSKWIGETEASIRNLFKVAAEKAPSVIFFDEADGLGRKREAGSGSGNSFCTSLITTLLTEINNVEPGSVLVILASNYDELLDPALIRKGRMDLTINIPLPDVEEQKKILEHYAKRKGFNNSFYPEITNLIINKFKEEVLQPSPADLKHIIEVIHRQWINRKFPNLSWMKMTLDQLREFEINGDDLSLEKDVMPCLKNAIISGKKGSQMDGMGAE